MEHLRKVSETPEPAVTPAELRFRQRAYLRHFKTLDAILPELHPGTVMSKIQETMTLSEADRVLYEATLARYEDEQRGELTKSNLELARQQVTLGSRLAEALEEMRRLTAYQVAKPSAVMATATAKATGEEMSNMSEAEAMIQRRDAERLRVLRAIFDDTGGSERRYVITHGEKSDIAVTGLAQDAIDEALTWLEGEGLIEPYAMGAYKLTHEGLREVERSIRNPDRETAHFTPTVIHMSNTFNGPVGAFQAGADATANVQQNIGALSADREKVLADVDRAAADIEDPKNRETAVSLAKAIREEMTSAEPSAPKVTAYASMITALTAAAPTVEHVVRVLFGV